ncbi:MAG: SPOR domain-containing protein [Proteobacteria bacterium]|nr:hypothetical protein [Desulfobulbaceae bacterium]MBU4152432.1 SPOR domain-containing protein [Pseudomonadota bacterium]
MARKAPKENALVRIELGIGGLLGLVVVVFCVFLWMYLFGVWTGQSGLQSTLATGDPRELISAATRMLKESPPPPVGTPEADAPGGTTAAAPSGTQTQTASPATISADKDKENAPSFFAIQVGAFRDEQRALKAVAQWRVRDYDAFYLKPDAEGTFFRVLVGHFDSLAEANTLASKLESSEQNKVFISLVSENQKSFPAASP